MWQLLSVHLMCLCFWFCHSIMDFSFWIVLGESVFFILLFTPFAFRYLTCIERSWGRSTKAFRSHTIYNVLFPWFFCTQVCFSYWVLNRTRWVQYVQEEAHILPYRFHECKFKLRLYKTFVVNWLWTIFWPLKSA